MKTLCEECRLVNICKHTEDCKITVDQVKNMVVPNRYSVEVNPIKVTVSCLRFEKVIPFLSKERRNEHEGFLGQ